MRFMLDANVIIMLLAGSSVRLAERISALEVGTVGISAIAFAEVALGSRNGKRPSMIVLDQLPRRFEILPFDHLAAKTYAVLPLERGSYDRLIAAHAISLNLTLVTNNEANFADIPGLRVENWTVE